MKDYNNHEAKSEKVTTTIPHSLAKQAQFAGISWSTALQKGIEFMLARDNEETLRQKVKETETMLDVYKGELEEFKEKKKKKTAIAQVVREHVQTISEMKIRFDKKNATLPGLTNLFNNTILKDPSIFLNPAEFYSLMKDVAKGKLKNNTVGVQNG